MHEIVIYNPLHTHIHLHLHAYINMGYPKFQMLHIPMRATWRAGPRVAKMGGPVAPGSGGAFGDRCARSQRSGRREGRTSLSDSWKCRLEKTWKSWCWRCLRCVLFQQRTWFLWDKTHVIYDKAVILFGDGQGAENHQRWGRTNAWWELGSSGGLSWATVDGNGWAK